ncbi:MAG: hypothetical protein IT236_05990 [Bacteroidia bacterium]|nr:hypothetical protein [Bacteroidia bacterium]
MSYLQQPLGTIISSVLNYDQFCDTIHENPAINNVSSTYVPCDGRSIIGSKLEKLTVVGPKQPHNENHMTNAPDLRGRFFRGLNHFYSAGEPDINLNLADPDGQGRKVNTFQADIVGKHKHTVSGSVLNCGMPPGYHVINNTATPNYTQETSDTGGSETRPKNIAVYYYIRIN